MRAAGKTFTLIVTTILSLGLLYSQVCNLACAFAACSDQAKFERPVQNKENGHCQHHETSAQSAQDSQPEPQQPSGSHDCNTHNTISSLLPVKIAGANWLHQSSQPDVVVPFIFTGFSLDHMIGGAAETIPFRSPPRRPQRSILRI